LQALGENYFLNQLTLPPGSPRRKEPNELTGKVEHVKKGVKAMKETVEGVVIEIFLTRFMKPMPRTSPTALKCLKLNS